MVLKKSNWRLDGSAVKSPVRNSKRLSGLQNHRITGSPRVSVPRIGRVRFLSNNTKPCRSRTTCLARHFLVYMSNQQNDKYLDTLMDYYEDEDNDEQVEDDFSNDHIDDY